MGNSFGPKTRAMTDDEAKTAGKDYWFNIVEMLQQNWAFIVPNDEGSVTVKFVDGASRVFDRLHFPTASAANDALLRNGFRPYADDLNVQSFIVPPLPPFEESSKSNRPIYSSRQFWR